MKIHMTGGSPWGFKMTGGHDFRQPLAIGKVTAGSKADRAGVKEGHHILSVNGEDVTQLAHLEAQNKIKAAKTSLTLELSNAPLPKPVAPEVSSVSYTSPAITSQPPTQTYSNNRNYNSTNKTYAATNKPPTSYNSSPAPSHSKSVSLPSKMSTPRSPSTYSSPHNKTPSYDEPNSTPDVEYRRVDSRDSQRRMYEELQDTEYSPTAHQSTLQSPSMQALARSSEQYGQSYVMDSEKKSLQITAEIRDLILEEEDGRQNGHHQQAAALRPTGAGMKVHDPQQRSPMNSSPAAYAPPSSSDFVQPPTYSPPSSYQQQQPPTYSPPSTYQQQQPEKSKAVGNIAKFLQSSGAKQGPPTFLKTLQDLRCPYGDPAVLEIRIGNTLPVPTINWYHNEKPIRESREKDIKFLNRGIVHTLVFGEFGQEFSGRYRCVLTNKHGSASCSSILSQEQLGDDQGFPEPPQPTYANNSSTRGYQPTYSSTYQAPVNNYQSQTHRVLKPPVVSISVGLYSQGNVGEAYAVQTKKQQSREEDGEESAVMRALREEGRVNDKPSHKSRSMRMLEETLSPESDDL